LQPKPTALSEKNSKLNPNQAMNSCSDTTHLARGIGNALFSTEDVHIWMDDHLWIHKSSHQIDCLSLSHDTCRLVAAKFVELLSGPNSQLKFQRGEYIWRSGMASQSMYFLESGVAREVSMDGKQTLLIAASGGTGFGEVGLLTGDRRTTDLIAERPCVVREFTRGMFDPVADAMPALREVLQAIAEVRSDPVDLAKQRTLFIGRSGYKSTISNLPREFAKFNGTVVQPRRVPPPCGNDGGGGGGGGQRNRGSGGGHVVHGAASVAGRQVLYSVELRRNLVLVSDCVLDPSISQSLTVCSTVFAVFADCCCAAARASLQWLFFRAVAVIVVAIAIVVFLSASLHCHP
jgi:CRP-like cAMP-binding protein